MGNPFQTWSEMVNGVVSESGQGSPASGFNQAALGGPTPAAYQAGLSHAQARANVIGQNWFQYKPPQTGLKRLPSPLALLSNSFHYVLSGIPTLHHPHKSLSQLLAKKGAA